MPPEMRDEIGDENSPQSNSRHWKYIRGSVVGILGIALIWFAGVRIVSMLQDLQTAIPDVEEWIDVDMTVEEPDLPPFTLGDGKVYHGGVPPDTWADLEHAIRVAQKISRPAEWRILGFLTVKSKRSDLKIRLFVTSRGTDPNARIIYGVEGSPHRYDMGPLQDALATWMVKK